MNLTRKSQLTGAEHTREIPVDPDKLRAWIEQGHSAPLIQNHFPELSDDDREFIMTGITPEEWEGLFG